MIQPGMLFPTVRYIKSLDIRPSKRHGQNFLIDKTFALKTLLAAAVAPGETVIEIGPGLGALTCLLHNQQLPAFSYEIDKRLYQILSSSLPENSSVKLYNRDILMVSFSDAAKIYGPVVLLGSIPYSITTDILLKILDENQAVARSVLIVQKEVAQRICAMPGGKDYGILSVYCTAYLQASIETIIPPGCFFPVPQVHSALLRLIPTRLRQWHDPDEVFFRTIVRASFSKRRKTIINSLKALLIQSGLDLERFSQYAALQNIDLSRRAETFSTEEFYLLTSCVKSFINKN
jgi:16S rRNA (adenine1518-N6/adenine1519-N6)-dimethyltransferase